MRHSSKWSARQVSSARSRIAVWYSGGRGSRSGVCCSIVGSAVGPWAVPGAPGPSIPPSATAWDSGDTVSGQRTGLCPHGLALGQSNPREAAHGHEVHDIPGVALLVGRGPPHFARTPGAREHARSSSASRARSQCLPCLQAGEALPVHCKASAAYLQTNRVVREDTMPYATIAKEFIFEAAHSLPNHNGPCRRLHGHTYRVQIVARGPLQPLDGRSEEGMVVDFTSLKEVFTRRIVTRCDHQYLNETVPVPRTTAECLAVWMLTEVRAELPQVIAVRVYETPTSYAEVTAADLADEE